MKKKILILALILSGLSSVFFFNSNVSAAIDESRIMKKWLLMQYVACVGYDKNAPTIQNLSSTNNKNNYVASSVFDSSGAKTRTMSLPSYNYGGVDSNKKISCNEMFMGSNNISNKGLLSYSALNGETKWTAGGEQIFGLLSKLGYQKTPSNNTSNSIQINVVQEMNTYTNTISPPLIVYKNGKYESNGGGANFAFEVNVDNNAKTITAGVKAVATENCVMEEPSAGIKTIPIGATFNDTVNNLKNVLTRNLKWTKTCGYGFVSATTRYSFPQSGDYIVTDEGDDYSYVRTTASLVAAVNNLGGFNNGMEGVYLSASERYSLYLYYLNRAAGGRISCDPESTEGYVPVRLKDDSGKMNENCYVDFNGKDPDGIEVNVQSEKSSSAPVIKSVTLKSVIKWLKDATYTKDELKEMPSVGDAVAGSVGDPGDKVQMTCDNSGGTSSLGWIVCPVMRWLGNAATGVYENYVEPSLRVDPKLFTGGTDGIRAGWENFRNIANTLFIILLLVVIFSQLTGVGIDNYGIKKILPKLIVAAILINLSYLICILFVDLSNILGNGLRSMFDGLATSGPPTLSIPDATSSDGSALALEQSSDGGLVTVAVIGALVVMVGAVWNNPAIVLSLLVAALGVAVSIFFLFVLLAVREAAIVVLIVVSPLVVAAYMLPNTKKLFDKWWKLFQGLLLVYPICGLLVGGGNYVSRLLLSANFAGGGFLNAFTAMIVGIVPVFFIPTVLKGSFSAMGKLGDKLGGLGRTARSGATSKLRNSEGYKNAQRRGLERRAKVKAGYSEKKGRLNWKGNLKNKLASSGGIVGAVARGSGWSKSYAGYVNKAEALRQENIDARKTLANAGRAYDVAKNPELNSKDYAEQQILKAAGKGAADLEAAVAAVVASGTVKEKDIAGIIRDALNSGGFDKLEKDGSLRGVLEKMHSQYGSGFLATDYELGQYVQRGGTDENGRSCKLGKLGEYASQHIDLKDVKPEDMMKLSGDSMGAMIATGKINKQIAQDILAKNPNISGDKKIMLGAIADGKTDIATICNGSPTVEDAVAKFRADAEKLLAGQNVINGTIHANPADAEKWTAPKPQDVHIV
ncbi:hypothetical protein IKE98_00350 [Candidatus Saccharibacteria bacterium]|nr:hypothetical protein [Candidatus Saccharibacteria bacterium]